MELGLDIREEDIPYEVQLFNFCVLRLCSGRRIQQSSFSEELASILTVQKGCSSWLRQKHDLRKSVKESTWFIQAVVQLSH
jgi:hypothetical protein